MRAVDHNVIIVLNWRLFENINRKSVTKSNPIAVEIKKNLKSFAVCHNDENARFTEESGTEGGGGAREKKRKGRIYLFRLIRNGFSKTNRILEC